MARLSAMPVACREIVKSYLAANWTPEQQARHYEKREEAMRTHILQLRTELANAQHAENTAKVEAARRAAQARRLRYVISEAERNYRNACLNADAELFWRIPIDREEIEDPMRHAA